MGAPTTMTVPSGWNLVKCGSPASTMSLFVYWHHYQGAPSGGTYTFDSKGLRLQ